MSFKDAYSQPCTTPEQSPFSGRTFLRDWLKICPTCGDTFFARRLESEYHQPYQVDPEPPLLTYGPSHIVKGMRETCGHPQCHEVEVLHQAQRSPDWWKAHDFAYPNHGETNPQPPTPYFAKPKGLRKVGV